MIIPKGFAYEIQHPQFGERAHLVVRYLDARTRRATGVSGKNWACLTNLHVVPALRGRGAGKALLALLRGWQRKAQVNVVFRASPYRTCRMTEPTMLHHFYCSNGFDHLPGNDEYHYRHYQWTHGPRS